MYSGKKSIDTEFRRQTELILIIIKLKKKFCEPEIKFKTISKLFFSEFFS